MKPWARDLALALLLSAAIPATAVYAADSAEQILLDKANYWRLKDRPDLAADALNKLLAINPNQPDALFQYGVLQVQLGKTAEAQRYLARLQQAAPGDPRAADLENAIRSGKVSPSELGEARRLAQSGQLNEAVQKYQQTFKGPPPSTFGVEYYMTLAGTPGGWEEAHRGLQQLVQASPNDRQLKLSLAEVLTYREPTRSEGIAQLVQLSKDPVVGPQATQAWRQALTWASGSPSARGLYQQYLAQYPQDTEIQRLAAEAAKPAVGAGATSEQSEAYAALKRGNVAAAERAFNADLRARPDDAQAMAGLGLVRLREQRFAAARDLIGRAMRLSPENRRGWQAAYDSAAFWATVQEAKSLAASGNYARGRDVLTPLLSRSRADNWGAELVLANIDQKLGDNAGAEQAYRRVLQARPGNADALVGLAGILAAEGKTAEAQQISGRLTPEMRARVGGNSQGEVLRTQAKAAEANGDSAAAEAKFRQAITVDPNNPWIRLDYARFLAGRGQMPQAFAAVDPAATGNTPTSILAAAMFDTQQDRWDVALERIDRIPPAQRTQDINNFHDRVVVRGTIDKAKRLAAAGNRTEARRLLVALYADPKINTEEKRQVPHLLVQWGDSDTAFSITRDLAGRPGAPGVKGSLDYAMVLLEAGYDKEAATVVGQLEASGRLGADDQDDLAAVKTNLAAREADQLTRTGDYAQADAVLAPMLAAKPNDPSLLLSAGRLAAMRGHNREALQDFDKAYQQDPGNVYVVRGAVGGALQARDIDQAEDYLNQGFQTFPNDPWLYYLKAQIAHARGDNREALEALATARSLNSQQGAGGPPTTLPTSTTAPPLPPPMPLLPGETRRSEAAPSGFSSLLSLFIGSAAAAEPPPPRPPSPVPALIASSADSEDLVFPPIIGERPAMTAADPAPVASASGTTASAAQPVAPGGAAAAPATVQLAQAELLVPPPIEGLGGPYGAPSGTPAAQESLELDIQRSIEEIEAEAAPMVQGGVAVRARDGQAGLGQLTEVGVSAEARFSPFWTGTARLAVLPVYLNAGTISSGNLATFGANPILAALGAPLARAGEQTASGVGLLASYGYGPVDMRIGTTPLGFPASTMIGGVTVAPTFDAFTVRMEASREPVTDTLLSYAGTHASLASSGAATGGAFGHNPTWGGVTRNGGRAMVVYDDNLTGIYAGAGAGWLFGTNVAQNSEIDGIVGGYYRPYRTETDVLSTGVALLYLGYDKNLSGFSYGQGGYFSPQNYEALMFPVEYRGRTGRWTYLGSVALGVQHFNQHGSAIFPNNPAAEAQLIGAGANGFNAGLVTTSFAANLKGQIDYALDQGVSIGAAAGFNNGRNYNEGIVKLYIRKTFGGQDLPPATVPSPAGPPIPSGTALPTKSS